MRYFPCFLRFARFSFFPAIIAFMSIALAMPLLAATNGFVRYPDIHGDRIVFTSSGDLFTAPAEGGQAIRLTSHEGEERFAHFSADGKWIAFSGNYYGNEDVFVIPAEGGEPKQLTFHSSQDEVVGWDPEGRVIFRSRRDAPFHAWELYTVDINGGYPEKLQFFRGANIAYEPDGDRVALVLTFLGFHPWKRYQGGYAEKIWVGTPSAGDFRKITHWPGNESFPMWDENGRIFFTCDSLGRNNIWSMLPDGGELRRETDFTDYDLRWPSLGDGRIIFQYGMDLGVYDIASGAVKLLDLTVPSDDHLKMTKWVDASEYLTWWSLSGDGKRLLVTARGELFTLPVEASGLIRQWTRSSGSREKFGEFLPGADGALVAISDFSSEEEPVRIDGPGEAPTLLEDNPQPGWKYRPVPSPDGKYIAYADYTLQLFIVDLKTGERSAIDRGEWEITEYTWSPDSRYLAYTLPGFNYLGELRIYDTRTGETHSISDKRFNTSAPAWDPQGRYLYCITDRNFSAYQDYNRALFFYDHTATLALYMLQKDLPSPFIARGDAPSGDAIPEAAWLKQDGENGKKKEKKKQEKEEDSGVTPVKIDFDGLAQRMVALPEGPGNYSSLKAAGDKLYFMERGTRSMLHGSDQRDYNGPCLRAFDLGKRSSDQVASSVSGYDISGDGKVLVVRSGESWYYGDAEGALLSLDNDHRVPTDGWSLEVTPKEEWKQILREAWRLQRDFFYDPNLNGVDWNAVYARYAPFLDRVVTRDDLRDLIREIQSELHAGHAYVGPGDEPHPPSTPVGFLGVDLEPDEASGFYRITRVLNPEPGTSGGSSPLIFSDPECGPGTYILAVNGRKAEAGRSIMRLLQNTADREVALTLNEKPTFAGAREVIIKALPNERKLRYLDWVRRNREFVDRRSNGKIGYIQLPDMSGKGLSRFGSDYYGQRDKQALIVDDRYNGGGNVAEYILKELKAKAWAVQSARRGTVEIKPHGAFLGHIAVLCNGETMSDGESFAEATRLLDLGPLIGERTWGGWVWIRNDKPLVDRAYITEPEFGGWGFDGKWMIEGKGVDPDIEVVNNPGREMFGEDQQLDAAIDYLLERLASEPVVIPKRPAGPVKR